MITLAIDPGANGGLALRTPEGTVAAEKMPDGLVALNDRIRRLHIDEGIAEAIVENVGGYRPGNSAPAAVKFARHCGHIDAILVALSIPVRLVAPKTWQKRLGALPKDKAERKAEIARQMRARYPHLRVTLATADALAILTTQAHT